MLLHVVAGYLVLGFVPVLLATIVEDFWPRVLSGVEYKSGPEELDEAIEFCLAPSSLPILVLLWPLILLMAYRLWKIRRDAAGLKADCDRNEAMSKDMPGAVLALEASHDSHDCILCRVDARACAKLAIFHEPEDLDKDEGRAMVFSADTGDRVLYSETRRVAQREGRYFIFEPAEENLGERFNRRVLTGILNGDASLACLLPSPTETKGPK